MSQIIGVFDQNPFHSQSASGITQAGTVATKRIVLSGISIVNPGSSGSLQFNDASSLAGASSSNLALRFPYTALYAGLTLTPSWPFLTGLVIGAIPTGAVISVSVAGGSITYLAGQ